MLRKIFSILFLFCAFISYAQRDIHPVRLDTPPVIDGMVDDEVWNNIPGFGDYWQQFPLDSVKAMSQTILRIGYDDTFIYIAAICKSSGNDFITTTLRRDYDFRSMDNLTLIFDTYADNTNAFAFGMNAAGVRREALISNGGRDYRNGDWQSSWDNKWTGESYVGEDYWSAEFAIPLKSIRYNEGSTLWNFNSYRNDTQNNEISTYTRVPNNRILMDLNWFEWILMDVT